MRRKFINRLEELKFLEERDKGAQLIVIYGRRRVGKTELIKEFFKDKPHIYFLADKRGTANNAKRFAKKIAEYFNDVVPEVKNFDDVFTYLLKRINKKRFIVVIDEFSHLVEKDDSIPSVFQLVWDELLKQTKAYLILCGSSISMMEKGTLSYKSPLYGRRTGQWKVNPLLFKDVRKFFPRYKIKRVIETFSILGDIPAYLVEFDDSLDVMENVQRKVLKKGAFLYEEVDFLLKEELREPSSYMSILEAMSAGATKLSEIATKAGINARDMPKYFKVLKRIGLVEQISPVTEKKSKKTLYRIGDHFFRFWFRFVQPNKSYLEEGAAKFILKLVAEGFDQYVAYTFENVCVQALKELNKHNKLPFKFSRIGGWWIKGSEIDIVALNEQTREILFAECKWSNKKVGMAIINELLKKKELVKWHNDKRREFLAIFSKAGFEKRSIDYAKGKNILLFGLEDLERAF